MDASTRWETAAIRSSSRGASGPPLPTAKRVNSTTTWVSLKEAEAATSVPVNTLRKWVRKADLPSYLESDGDVALRMVDLDAVVSRARKLGRHVEPLQQDPPDDLDTRRSDSGAPPEIESGDSAASSGTMIVPVDAFNKMLSQLGNLHQAGQQLAEARERAAKAETEATFLRQRLAELRSEHGEPREPETSEPESSANGADMPGADLRSESLAVPPHDSETTTYWRYLTTGWSERRKSRRTND